MSCRCFLMSRRPRRERGRGESSSFHYPPRPRSRLGLRLISARFRSLARPREAAPDAPSEGAAGPVFGLALAWRVGLRLTRYTLPKAALGRAAAAFGPSTGRSEVGRRKAECDWRG